MQKCAKCGTFDAKNSEFCAVCGAPLQVYPHTETSGMPIIALILAIVGLGLCGPATAIPAFLMAKKSMATPLSPRDQLYARIAYWVSIAVFVIWGLILGLVAIGALASPKSA